MNEERGTNLDAPHQKPPIFGKYKPATVTETSNKSTPLSLVYRVAIVGAYSIGAIIGNIMASFPYLLFIEGFFGPNNVPQLITVGFLLSGTILGAMVIGKATSKYLHGKMASQSSGASEE